MQIQFTELNPIPDYEQRFRDAVRAIWANLDEIEKHNPGSEERIRLQILVNLAWVNAMEILREGVNHDVHSAGR